VVSNEHLGITRGKRTFGILVPVDEEEEEEEQGKSRDGQVNVGMR